ncbi:Endonuclease/exonuclease/phosphatase family protein [uncultured virus]|nr:Endonuclease/exonuclease/phosphatase family protein [uncultured virus]
MPVRHVFFKIIMVSVVQYNILSSKLAAPDYYIKCDPNHLKSKYRLQKIKERLCSFISSDAIICLQEIPQSWVGALHDVFAANKYSFITSLYGNFTNDYMGVGIAYPLNRYHAEDTSVVHVGASIPVPRKKLENFLWRAYDPFYINLYQALLCCLTKWKFLFCLLLAWILRGIRTSQTQSNSWIYQLLKRCFGWSYHWAENFNKPPFDAWSYSNKRPNTVIMTKLTDMTSNQKFTVATYHMPCAYWEPKVLTTHTIEVFKIVQRYAAGIPLIFAGDFNFNPASHQYNIVTSGIDPSSLGSVIKHPDHPDVSALGMIWDQKIIPMSSAYKTAHGSEPPFTTQTYTKVSKSIFKDTLDYIFYVGSKPCSDLVVGAWTVSSVEVIKDVEGTVICPNEHEPSDHLPLQVLLTMD